MTAARPARQPDIPVLDACCPQGTSCAEPPMPVGGDARWRRAARAARWLAWASLTWMCAEGAIGLWQGLAAGSIGADRVGAGQRGGGAGQRDRDLAVHRHPCPVPDCRASRAARRRRLVLAAGPYIAAESIRDLAVGHHAGATVTGMVLTAVALLVMLLLGRAKHMLAARLGPAATAGQGTQNYVCAAQAAAVLAALAITAAWRGWWIDPVIGLALAAIAVREGTRSWRGNDCC